MNEIGCEVDQFFKSQLTIQGQERIMNKTLTCLNLKYKNYKWHTLDEKQFVGSPRQARDQICIKQF